MYCLFQNIRNNKGFSLIEVSIALVIMGIVATLSTSVFHHFSDSHKTKVTKEKQETLLKVLAQFALLNKRLPNAADPKALLDKFGEESNLTVGLIPYRTLGISEAMAKDDYGNYFTYAMQPFPKRPEAVLRRMDFCTQSPTSRLLSVEENGVPIIIENKNKDIIDFIAVVIVSHGKNGYGAYVGSPGNIKKKTEVLHGKDEEINADGTGKFISRLKSNKEENYFDDQVIWVPRNILASAYGGESCYRKENTKIPTL